MTRLLAIAAATLALVAALAGASSALAAGPVITHVSAGGSSGGNDAYDNDQGSLSADGSCAAFSTTEALSSADTNSRSDIYMHCAGSTTKFVSGPALNSTPHFSAPGLLQMTPSGNCVLFHTGDQLTADDHDTRWDVYKRCGDAIDRVSQGPAGGDGGYDVNQAAISADGNCVLVGTSEALTSEDTDSWWDLYERCGTTTKEVTIGPNGGNSVNSAASIDAITPDGSCVMFTTNDALTSDDSGNSYDTYVRCGTSIRRVSTGPTDSSGDTFSESGDGLTADGSCALFETDEPLVASDSGTDWDIYKRCGSTTTLMTPGTSSDVYGGDHTPDLRCVMFTTDQQLTSGDTDSADDIYRYCDGGPVELISTGPAGGTGSFNAESDYISDDGRCVVFDTSEHLAAGDTDTTTDAYKRCDGATTLVSAGPAGGNADGATPTVHGISPDGTRVVFSTSESLTADDTNTTEDVYENSNGRTTLMSPPRAQNTIFGSSFRGMSSDGSTLLTSRGDQLLPSDTDDRIDLYLVTASPTASSADATDVTQTGATLHGSSYDGPSAGYRFEYGATTAYGSSTPTQPLPSGGAPHALSAAISGLAAGTTYHYRLVVTSDGGTTQTADRTFTTDSPPTTTPAEHGDPGLPRPDRFAGVVIARKTAVVKHGVAKVRVTCPAAAQGACAGTLALKAKRAKLGRASFAAIAPGRSVVVRVKLSRTGLKLLAPRVKVSVTAVARDARGVAARTTAQVSFRR